MAELTCPACGQSFQVPGAHPGHLCPVPRDQALGGASPGVQAGDSRLPSVRCALALDVGPDDRQRRPAARRGEVRRGPQVLAVGADPVPLAVVASAKLVYNRLAPLYKLGFGEIIFKCVNEPVAPDAVVGVQRVAALAARDAVIKARVGTRHQLNARVVAAEALSLQLRPHDIILITLKAILPEAIAQPVHLAVPACVRLWPATGEADASCTLFDLTELCRLVPSGKRLQGKFSRWSRRSLTGRSKRSVQSFKTLLPTLLTSLEWAARHLRPARVTRQIICGPLLSLASLAGDGPGSVLVRARTAVNRCAALPAYRAAGHAQAIGDSVGLSRIVSHTRSLSETVMQADTENGCGGTVSPGLAPAGPGETATRRSAA